MYNETDLNEVKGQLRKTVILVTGIFTVFLIISIAFMLRLPEWMGAAFMSFGLCLVIFIWGVYGTPIYSYYNYIKEIIQGRVRETKAIVVKIKEEPVYKDNRLLYYEIIVNDVDDGVDKIFLYDDNKGKPCLTEGKSYIFHTYQNFITSIESL